MEPSIKEIVERVEKLEKARDGGLKFFVQYLLSPLLVVIVGLVFNWQIESSKKEVQQLQLAYSMLNTLFSDDEIKTLATKRLMDEVLTREDLKNAIGIMVDEYLNKKFRSSIDKGDLETAKQISEAAAVVGGVSGEKITKMIQTNPSDRNAITSYDKARELELKAFDALLLGDDKAAIRLFVQLQQVYPSFHSVDEILQLLRRNEAELGQPMVQGKIYREILQNYSWKLPQNVIARLKEKSAVR